MQVAINIVSFEVVREFYTDDTVHTFVERTCKSVMAATGYVRRHRDELGTRERYGINAVTAEGLRVAIK